MRARSVVYACLALALGNAAREAAAADPPLPPPLSSVAIPEPSELDAYVRDRAAAVALGKALFWDMQVGSDGKTACATCHFRAGADPRARGQVSPGLLRIDAAGAPQPDRRFDLPLERALAAADFPLRLLADPLDRASLARRDTNDVIGSQGVAFARFATDRFGRERSRPAPDPDGFTLRGHNLRRVTGRHAPSVVNAVFQHRAFWDGRAQPVFNGVNEWGDRDADARVWRAAPDGSLEPVRLRIERAALASQALAPLVSSIEMSAEGRTIPDVGRRMAPMRPLAAQRVHPRDSVLGPYVREPMRGLAIESYRRWIEVAFQPEWWRSQQRVGSYGQLEANFGLFFGLAVQLYEATLVSDDTPFDRWRAGDESAVSDAAARGADLFRSQTRGRCINCHSGPELTDASFAAVSASPVRIREGQALDRGYNNIGLRDTREDPGAGGDDAWGRPLGAVRTADPPRAEPLAVDGAFKAPGLRNVELTAPYFHDGGQRTLEEVVEVYSRGGDVGLVAARDGAPIAPLVVLRLGADEQADLVAFLRALTDERVRHRRAPFDHPQLFVPDGRRVFPDGRVGERWTEVPAVGRRGGAPLPGFLEDARDPKFARHR